MSPDPLEIPLTRELQAAAAAHGVSLAGAQPLAGDGSDRRFFRLPGTPTLVILYHPRAAGGDVNENDSYYHIGRHLRSRGIPVPEIFHYCRDEGWMLLEDLGDVSLEAAAARLPESQVRYRYRQALEILVRQQLDGVRGFDPAWCFDTPAVDRTFLLERECGYFVRAFLQGYLGLDATMEALAPDFDRLLARAIPDGEKYFLHRDYQSRNLMIKDGRLRIIDFQGGRRGPLGYDVAALLIDPYVNLKPDLQKEFFEYYLDLLAARQAVYQESFRDQYFHLSLCRSLQILGAFGYLTQVKKKDYFARYIPAALGSLARLLAQRPGKFLRLEQVVASLLKTTRA
ncbi:MAG: aminoglycoside phosphotransferase [Deltaproteobacteria bacterium]|nr:aminoglycoside phosphotransferase [Deltaproteobacteria bacterium]